MVGYAWIELVASPRPLVATLILLRQLPRARCALMRPLPLRERATRCVSSHEWVRGIGASIDTPTPLTHQIARNNRCSPLPQGERAQIHARRPRQRRTARPLRDAVLLGPSTASVLPGGQESGHT